MDVFVGRGTSEVHPVWKRTSKGVDWDKKNRVDTRQDSNSRRLPGRPWSCRDLALRMMMKGMRFQRCQVKHQQQQMTKHQELVGNGKKRTNGRGVQDSNLCLRIFGCWHRAHFSSPTTNLPARDRQGERKARRNCRADQGISSLSNGHLILAAPETIAKPVGEWASAEH